MPFEEGKLLERYPALSIRQPWAELVISGRKSIEVRTWWAEYRGPLWIHVGQTEDVELSKSLGLSGAFRGGFIGRVTLSTIIQFDRDRWDRWRNRHLSDGPMPPKAYGWILKDPVRLKEPVPASGKIGLFQLSDEMTETLGTFLPNL